MRQGLILSFFILGFSSIIAQTIILRELIISFYGNEFFIGVILAFWLIWVAIGSLISEKILNKVKNISSLLLSLHLTVGFFLFLEIFLIRCLKTLVGFPGEIPNLVYSFFSAFLITSPLCLILGIWWATSTRIFSKFYKYSEVLAVNRAYFWECLGFIFGGILFSFFLFQFQEFLISTILIFLNLGTIIFLVFRQKGYFLFKWISIFFFLISSFFVFSPYLAKLDKITANFRFKNQILVESTNSPYGNIAVTKIDNQYNFYESGLLLGPAEDTQFAEELIHLSFLQHPSPKKILLIGGGLNGVLNEILKHPIQEVYYVELDPELIEIAKNYISPELKKALFNQKVKIINTDGLYFLKETKEKFDLILVNLPAPSTALINRFYTKEFFEMVREKLNPDGIFVTHLPFSSSTPSKTLENINASLFKTLKRVFNKIIVIPEDTNFFLSSVGGNLTYDPNILIQRFKERQIKTKYVNESYINYRLSTNRIVMTLNLFEKNETAKINKDFSPISSFYQTLFWLDHFYLKLSNFFKNFSLSFWFIFTSILIFLTFFLFQTTTRPPRPPTRLRASEPLKKNLAKISPLFSVTVAGFSLMALEIIIIFAYQVVVGYLYFRIALIITALMIGMALGVWYGNRKIEEEKGTEGIRTLLKFHLFLIIYCLILPFILFFLSNIPWMLIKEVIILLCGILAGFLGATIFPFANQIYLSFQSEIHKKTGIIYGADLLGSSFGAIIPSIILIPVFGVFQSLIFLILINFWIILILFRGPRSGRVGGGWRPKNLSSKNI